MRHDQVNAMARLMGSEIEYIAKNYGARIEVDKDKLKELSKFVLEKFGFLAIDEIKKAYQMWASEEIKVEGAEMFGGDFNARQLGKVLSAYNEVRKKVLGNYLSIIQTEQEQIERDEKARIVKEKFEAEFPAIVMKAKETVKDWREVPVYFYDSIRKRWGIEFEPGEAQAIFDDAKELATLELKKEKEESLEGGLRARFEAMSREKQFEDVAKRIARKLAVFRKVIQNPDFQVAA